MKEHTINSLNGLNAESVSTDIQEDIEETCDIFVDNVISEQNQAITFIDQGCQVNTYYSDPDTEPSNTFICNRLMYINGFCDAETQTDIIQCTKLVVVPNRKKLKDKKCGTSLKLVDQSTQYDLKNDVPQKKHFEGFASIENDEQMVDLAGVTLDNMQFLLKRIQDVSDKCKISKEDRLFIFLTKIKTGMTFSAISVLFSVHRTTISRIFFSTLSYLASATRNLVFWLAKDVVQATMPDVFHPLYNKTRVIIDCTKFKIEVPSTVENRVFCYSNYKKTFTAKLLVGITPGGFISLKSSVRWQKK